ncbi:hypothetical protein AB4Z54_54290, partial [Streptomyces sp. MCAF7]
PHTSIGGVLLRLLYLALTSMFTLLQLMPIRDRARTPRSWRYATNWPHYSGRPTNGSSPGQTVHCWPPFYIASPKYVFVNYR